MFCPNCGTQNDDAAGFCANCGTKLVEETASAPVNQAPVNQGQVNQAPKAPKAPMNSNQKTMIFAVIGAAVLLILFIVLGSTLSNPERVVKKYFKAQMEGKWDKVYECVDLPKGEFITKEAMKNAKADSDVSKVTNFEVEEWERESEIAKTYTVTYYLAGSSRRTTTVEVVKAGKTLLFWDRYKVSSGSVVAKNVRVTVKKDCKLFIDGTPVDDKYINADANTEKSANKTYEIDYMISGKHNFKTISDIYEDNERDAEVSYSDDTVSLTDYKVKESVIAERATAAQSDISTLILAGVDRKDFGAVKDMFYAGDSNRIDTIKKNYELYRDNTHKSDGTGVTKATIKNVEVTSKTSGTTNGMPYVKVTLKVSTDLVGMTTTKERTGSKTITDTLTYVFADGQWKLYDMSLTRLYV